MNSIAICNLKGGVGKTVTTVQLGAGLAARGHRVLMIDTDLQQGLTKYFDLDVSDGATTAEVLLDGTAVEDALVEVRPNLYVMPASSRMEIADRELPHLTGGDMRLRRALKNLQGFDYVLLDCPSGWGSVVRNAALAARWLLMPINSEPAALENATETENKALELNDFFAHDIETLGALITCWRSTKIAQAVADNTLARWPESTFETRIRRAERINELSAFRETVFDSDGARNATVRDDYAALAEEVIALCPPQKPNKTKAAKPKASR